MAMGMERMLVSKAVTEIVDVMLLSAPDKDDLSLSMKIYTTSKHFEDHDADILFHIKVQTNNKFDLESLLKKYGEHFKELSTLLTVMEQLEDTSHLCVQSVHDDNTHQVVLKNYKVCLTANDQNLPTELKCIGTTTKYKSSAQSMATTLHIRVYQEKTQMMIHSKWLYQYLRLVSFCSPKVQLDFTLKIHENLCVFDIRSPCTVTTNNGFEISGAATNYLKESEYQAVCPTVQPVSGDATLFLGVDIGLPTPENMLVSAVAFLSHCQSKNQLKSLATLSFFGPRCVPFFISPNGTDDFNPLSNIPWSSYRLMPLTTEELCTPLNEIPHNYYLKFKEESIKQQNCFVLTILLKFNLERDTQDLEKDIYLLNWLRCRLNSWFKEHKSRCMMVIENVVDKAFSTRHTPYTYSNDKESNCYSQAIPKIATAIFSVVSRSFDEKFRKQCFEMLQVDHSRAIENAVTKRLWSIAETRCGVAVPGDVQKIIEERYLDCDSDIVRCPDDGQVMEKYSFSDNESLRNYPARCMLPVETGEKDCDWSLQTDVDTKWQLLSQ